ncbi:MAG: glycosyltransferase [bacterium]|nr:glycosyltransferase [bacterium]
MSAAPAQLKPAEAWREAVADAPLPEGLTLEASRSGEPTLKMGGVYLHSRYRPAEEAARLVSSADLDTEAPVIVLGLGLGYHVLELVSRGYRVVVLEPDPAVVRLALDGPMRGSDVPIGVGDPDLLRSCDEFRQLSKQKPQFLVHPPTARLHPEFEKRCCATLAKCLTVGERLGVAVVGPMFGGSLPIAKYLVDAFERLGHRTLYVDNRAGYDLYTAMTGSVKSKCVSGQLSNLLINFLGEWSYAQVAEFEPEICIVMAQAPVGNAFPARLIERGIVTGYWFVENWRHMPYWKEISRLYDTFFHIQPGEFEEKLKEVGCHHSAFVQTACDPEVHRPVDLGDDERPEFECDLSFAGAGYHNRNTLLSGLTDYDMKIWGVEWHAKALLSRVCRPDERFSPEQFARIVAGSKINLNLHSSATHSGVDPQCDAINPRVFEIAACGGFQLCDPCIGLERLFDFDTELPVYRDLTDLRSQIDHYLEHADEREAVAKRARDRVLREHTYEHRAQEMLDAILDAHGRRIVERGVLAQRTVGEIAERVGRDSELGKYLATLPQDERFLQDTINERIPRMGQELSHPEAVFAYLREMRLSAEALLADFE